MVECHLAKVKVAGPNPVSRSTHSIGITDKQWHHSQEVRQGSAKSSPPVQVWVMPPKKYLAICEIFFYEINPLREFVKCVKRLKFVCDE